MLPTSVQKLFVVSTQNPNYPLRSRSLPDCARQCRYSTLYNDIIFPDSPILFECHVLSPLRDGHDFSVFLRLKAMKKKSCKYFRINVRCLLGVVVARRTCNAKVTRSIRVGGTSFFHL